MPSRPSLLHRIARKIVDFFRAEAPPARLSVTPAIIGSTAGWSGMSGPVSSLAAVATVDLARQRTVERILDGRTLDDALADNAKAISLQSTLTKPGMRRRNPPNAPT